MSVIFRILFVAASVFGGVACTGSNESASEEAEKPEWISEFEITEKTLLADFDRANLSSFEEPKFLIENSYSVSIWQYRRPFTGIARFYLWPGDRLRVYEEVPPEAYRSSDSKDFVRIDSNLFMDALPVAPRFVRHHLKTKGCQHFSGSNGAGEGDVAAIVTFSPEQFEEALATLNKLADKTAEGRQNVSVFRSEFTGSGLLLQILSDASWEIDPENVAYFKFSWSDHTGDIVMERDSLRAAFHEDWY